jgi:hypothetical protein
MNSSVTGLWNGKKEKFKHKFPEIKNYDLRFREGKEKEMIEKLGNKLGKSIQELLHIIITL